jgi:hypothetical protein
MRSLRGSLRSRGRLRFVVSGPDFESEVRFYRCNVGNHELEPFDGCLSSGTDRCSATVMQWQSYTLCDVLDLHS